MTHPGVDTEGASTLWAPREKLDRQADSKAQGADGKKAEPGLQLQLSRSTIMLMDNTWLKGLGHATLPWRRLTPLIRVTWLPFDYYSKKKRKDRKFCLHYRKSDLTCIDYLQALF